MLGGLGYFVENTLYTLISCAGQRGILAKENSTVLLLLKTNTSLMLISFKTQKQIMV